MIRVSMATRARDQRRRVAAAESGRRDEHVLEARRAPAGRLRRDPGRVAWRRTHPHDGLGGARLEQHVQTRAELRDAEHARRPRSARARRGRVVGLDLDHRGRDVAASTPCGAPSATSLPRSRIASSWQRSASSM